MALEDDIRTLSGVKLFESFTREQIRLIAFGSENLEVPAGREIYREGAEGDCAFVIASGTVDLVHDRDGKRVVLGKAEVGEILGELALITANRRIATAVARGNCELVFIPRQLFRRMLEEYPELAERLQSRIMHSVQRMLSEMAKVQEKMAHIPDLSAKTDGDIESGQHEEG